MIKTCLFSLLLLISANIQAQVINNDQDNRPPQTDPNQNGQIMIDKDKPVEDENLKDSVEAFQRYKIDGVAAVVGDYIILDSDIKKFRIDIQNRLPDNESITDCQIVGRLMENKLFSHAALQDSTVYSTVTEPQLDAQVDQQISSLVQQIGSIDKLLQYYRKDSEKELRDELFKIDKENSLAEAMQKKIVDDVEVTPEEVKQFFDSIPKDERPHFNDEVELSQIVINPKIPQEETDKVVDRLNQMRDEVLEGASFSTKAVLYSEGALSSKGGKLTVNPKDALDKDFKQIAFSLREGEISKPFKSSFGYHIVKVEKILGQNRIIRHIILIPKPTKASLHDAKEKTDSIRKVIKAGDITFAEAAKKYSEDDKTANKGGQLINPATGDTRFELTNIDPRIYNEVNNLKEGDVSSVLSDQDDTGKLFYKIITVTHKYPSHVADYSKDYSKIKEIALKKKQFEAVKKWREDEIEDTYVKISHDYDDCDFKSNWKNL